MKKCEICGNEFEIRGTGYSRKFCFECVPSENNRPKQITEIRKAMKKQAVKLKGGKCCICGYDKSIRALEFHHVDPNSKETGLGSGNTRSWEKFKKEIEKCILVCSNCHREIHSDD